MFSELANSIDGKATVADIVNRGSLGSKEPAIIFSALHQLADWGLIHTAKITPETVVKWVDPDIAKCFMALIGSCETYLKAVRPIAIHNNFPIYCYAALPRATGDQDKEWSNITLPNRYALGAGFDSASALLATLGEFCENIGSTQSDENSRITRASIESLGTQCVDPNSLMLFSKNQYEQPDRWNKFGHRYRTPAPLDSRTRIDWVTAKTFLGEKPVWVPAGYCFSNHFKDRQFLSDGNSNGMACALTRDEALVAGFLELIERDAVAIWWHNRIRRPVLTPRADDDPDIAICLAWLNQYRRSLTLLDLTHDFGIPVVAAFSTDSDGKDIAMGFGAHFHQLSAIKHALREMLQGLALFRMVEIQVGEGGVESLDPFARYFYAWHKNVCIKEHPHMCGIETIFSRKMSDFGNTATNATYLFDGSLERVNMLRLCNDIYRRKGYRIVALDQSPVRFKVKVIRVIIPGLRSFRTGMAPGRLFEVPVSMKWRSRPLPEEALLQIPIPM